MAPKQEKPAPRLKAFKFKIHPNEIQQTVINQTIGCNRFVFNHILRENLDLVNQQRAKHSKYEAIKRLPSLKATYEWLKDSDSIALQAGIEYLYEGYERVKKQRIKKTRQTQDVRRVYADGV